MICSRTPDLDGRIWSVSDWLSKPMSETDSTVGCLRAAVDEVVEKTGREGSLPVDEEMEDLPRTYE